MNFSKPQSAAFIALAGAALVSFPAAAQTPSFGPLTFKEGGPLHSIFFNPMTERLETVEPRAWHFHGTASGATLRS
ncbi:MAG: hypothetical protein HN396_17995 [Gemmatimonadales bacterium]|nr:hypothetical protein [Gemmatimonadales bacterium]MDG2241130.1 hypothetical protein [Longimicrobiales bacterium]MBT3500044.1 hypothetical protein [Gemmatimonadales bacterium]MBT3775378.1 hypothetical protein [Gemmatimonadales bacterium]MBT3959271.1 hypothetical protein [Gemmatimonadales bacterium]